MDSHDSDANGYVDPNAHTKHSDTKPHPTDSNANDHAPADDTSYGQFALSTADSKARVVAPVLVCCLREWQQTSTKISGECV